MIQITFICPGVGRFSYFSSTLSGDDWHTDVMAKPRSASPVSNPAVPDPTRVTKARGHVRPGGINSRGEFLDPEGEVLQ